MKKKKNTKKQKNKGTIKLRDKINISSFNCRSFCSNQESKLGECANFMLLKGIPIMTIQSHCITFDIGDNNTNIKTIM